MRPINNVKNRNRDSYSFANINLLGPCNVDCFFCLGKDIENLLCNHNHIKTHFSEWENFGEFLYQCGKNSIDKIYITGQNTDSLLYKYLKELIYFLHDEGFKVGLRTNGYLALQKMEEVNSCELSVGYSVHTLNPITNKMIMGRSDMPEWEKIINSTNTPRVQIVLNRCNKFEFFPLIRFLAQFKEKLRYIQVRRVSTDTRQDILAPDQIAYEEIYTQVHEIFPMTRKFVTDAEEYDMFGLPVAFWRTIKTSVNSMNYFTDGTISDLYFIIEGYLKSKERANERS